MSLQEIKAGSSIDSRLHRKHFSIQNWRPSNSSDHRLCSDCHRD